MQVLDEGQTVRHDQYGLGVVTESDAERTTVKFHDFGTRKFVTSLWTAEILGEPAGKPARSPRRSRRPRVSKPTAIAAGRKSADKAAKE